METKQTEVNTQTQNAGAPQKAPKKWKNPFRSNKFKRGGMATLLTVVFIAIVVALNVVATALTDRFPSLDIDMTAQGLNTLSEDALEVAKGVEQKTDIYLIGTEEAYDQNQIYTSYGLEYSQVANLARRLAEANSNIKVQFVDPDSNPEFVSQYSEDNLTTGKVLVKTEARYRVLTVTDLFSIEQDQTTGETNTYSMVDSALAGALEVVNMDNVPIFAIATGHDELLNTSNMASFIDMMENQNFEIEEVDLLTQDIPEGTQVLMLPTPTTDYSTDELDKIRAYLNNTTDSEPLTVLTTTYPTQGEMPNFSAFLEEWGVKVQEGVVAETDTNQMAIADVTAVLVDANEEFLQNNTYDRLVSYYSSPLELLFEANNSVTTYPLWTTSDSAYVLTEENANTEDEDRATSSQTVATLSSKYVQVDGSSITRSLLVFGSSNVFLDTFMSNAFSDASYVRDALLNLTGNSGSSVSVVTQRVQTNQLDITATRSTMDFWGIVFIAGIPVVILVAGLVIFLKRRHL
ncbi:MAG: Gldg family protein [Acutalibacter sp.]|jgi:ABC-2 type transport system permease protein